MRDLIRFWVFRSSSGRGLYQTIEWGDGTGSCDCPGWTRRNPPGGRTCKHVRLVLCGMADQLAERCGTDHKLRSTEERMEGKTEKSVQPAKSVPGRAFDFE